MLGDDTVRGIVLTDALIGTFTRCTPPTSLANRCFLYHVIGGGTGHWDVPVGGMGTVAAQLTAAAVRAGSRAVHRAIEVASIETDGKRATVRPADGRRIGARQVFANVAPGRARPLARRVGPVVPAASKGPR